ncbi:MAG: FtsX-like permease family protein [Lachnospiraceae bacterium]
MRKRALHKDLLVEIKKSLARFLSILFIVALGVSFFSGLQSSAPDMRYNADVYLDAQKLMDLRVVSSLGLTEEDVEALSEVEGVDKVRAAYMTDVLMDGEDSQLAMHVESIVEDMNLLTVEEGTLPTKKGEVALDARVANWGTYALGDTITVRENSSEEETEEGTDAEEESLLATDTYKITAIVSSPAYISFGRGYTTIGNGEISGFLYVTDDSFNMDVYPQIFIEVTDAADQIAYTEEYTSLVDEVASKVEAIEARQTQLRYDEIMAEGNDAIAEAESEMEDGRKEVQEQLSEARSKLDDAQTQIADGKQEIADGKAEIAEKATELENAKTELAAAKVTLSENEAALSSAWEKITQGRMQLDEAKAQITASEQEYAAKSETALAEIAAGEQQVAQGEAAVAAARKEIAAAKETLTAQKTKAQAAYTALLVTKEESQQTEAGKAAYNQKLTEIKAQLALLATQEETLAAQEAGVAAQETQIAESKEKLQAGRDELDTAKQQLEEGKRTIETQEAALADATAEATQGQTALTAGKERIAAAESELAAGETQLAQGRQELADAETEIAEHEQELADGEQEYAEAKAEADAEIADGEQKIADAKSELAKVEQPEWYITDRTDLPDFSGLNDNANRIRQLGMVFPVIFFLVAALISLTTMTRMVEDERLNIGTLKALGYGKWDIAFKYLAYAFLATTIGGIAGVLVGEKLFPKIIINAYGIMYPNIAVGEMPYNLTFALLSVGAAFVFTMGATFLACYKELFQTPASLMRPPAPKAGQRVIIERIKIIWEHLSFTWKATIRNLFRYKKRFFMTTLGIGGCMSLLVVGFGLRDSILDISKLQYTYIQTYDALLLGEADADQEDELSLQTMMSEDSNIVGYLPVYMQSKEAYYGKEKVETYVMVPETLQGIDEYLTFQDRTTQETYQLDDTGAILSEKMAKILGVEKGDTITFKDGPSGDVEVPVAEITENYILYYTYISPQLYEQLYGETAEYKDYLIKMQDSSTTAQNELGERLLAEPAATTLQYTSNMMGSMDDMLTALDSVIGVLILSAGLLAFVVLYNLNNINISERRRELATLKVLGFYDGEIAEYVYRENIVLTIIGALFGALMGIALHRYLIVTVEVDDIMFGRNIYALSYIYSILITFAFSIFVNFIMFFKLRKIDMVESLKSVE